MKTWTLPENTPTRTSGTLCKARDLPVTVELEVQSVTVGRGPFLLSLQTVFVMVQALLTGKAVGGASG